MHNLFLIYLFLQVLEEKFEDELSKQEVFYGMSYTSSQASTLSGRHMPWTLYASDSFLRSFALFHLSFPFSFCLPSQPVPYHIRHLPRVSILLIPVVLLYTIQLFYFFLLIRNGYIASLCV